MASIRRLSLLAAIILSTVFCSASLAGESAGPGSKAAVDLTSGSAPVTEEESASNILTATTGGMPLLKISLDEAASLAIQNSHNLAAQKESAISAHEAAASADTQRFPQIGIGGQTQFQSKIAEVSTPASGTIQVGDHYSWSVGPVLNWVAWDAGAIAKNAKSMYHTAEAEKISEDSVQRNVLYNSRMAYFSVQLACEQLYLVADALRVARAQLSDVDQRYRVGSADRLDAVTAHQEVVDRERDYQDAQRELAVQLRNLYAILGAYQQTDPMFPVDSKLSRVLKSEPTRPDLIVNLDSLNDSISQMMPRASGIADISKHPNFQSAEERVKSAKLAYESARAGHWPKVTVTGQSVMQYPNFGDLSTVNQNQLTLGLSVPVIDWGMVSKKARSQKHKTFAAIEQMKETERGLSRDLAQTKDRIALLKQSRTTSAAIVKDAVEAASLVYEEYQAGHLIFLEVQRANLKALQSKVEAARVDAQLLGQLAQMESLITEGL